MIIIDNKLVETDGFVIRFMFGIFGKFLAFCFIIIDELRSFKNSIKMMFESPFHYIKSLVFRDLTLSFEIHKYNHQEQLEIKLV